MKKLSILVAIAIVLIAVWRVVLPVDETEYVMVTRFGEVVGHPIYQPGLHMKMPWYSAIRLDKRLQTFDPSPAECLLGSKATAEKKSGVGSNVVVDYFVNWRIRGLHSPAMAEKATGEEKKALLDGPRKFFSAVNGSMVEAERRLQEIVASKISATLGRHEISALASTNPDDVDIDEIEKSVLLACREVARNNLCVEIEDIRIKRIGLPEKNKKAVFERMREERRTKATQFRAEGQLQAKRIVSKAEAEAKKILADARRDAEQIKGKADANATAIYAKAHSKDPDFYRLVRTLDAYRKFLNENTTVVLSGNSELLKLLSRGELPATKSEAKPEKPKTKPAK
ncbi:MAG: protease modulator HflC [Planctomycetes bacterium]|nr:protease modulator HflC [Planctomycetota bacterium]